ncbi:hypothetical protein ACF3NS_10870 [Arsenicicoccus cauae]|uniref:hypothetical protein n=1 Tax=Arsenicicoccus cauae TaxID=2663847 RepID=UPI00370DBC02
MEAALPLPSIITGGFAGAAVFFDTGFDLGGALLAIVVGTVFVIVSEKVGGLIQSSIGSAQTATTRVATPTTRGDTR